MCGTPHYHAPEAVRGDGHGLPAQLWAFGVLMVEMLAGRAPFWAAPDNPPLTEQILAAAPDLSMLPETEQALARALFQALPEEREAIFPSGYASVRGHACFGGLDWAAIEAGECVPAFDFRSHSQGIVRAAIEKDWESQVIDAPDLDIKA